MSIKLFILLFMVSWLVLALIGVYCAKRIFRKYKHMPRKDLPPKYRHIVRRDIGKWGEYDIIRGCFLHFPLSVGALATYSLTLGALIALQKRLGCLHGVIEAYRVYCGWITKHIMFRLTESFGAFEKITTPMVVANHISENDHIYMTATLSKVCFVAKKSIGDVPVYGNIARYFNTLFVDRECT